MDKKNKDFKHNNISIAVERLKKVYKEKLLPLEKNSLFENFYSPPLTDAVIEAKPSVLLLGQYSVGKTTFVKYILDREFPGCNIGPEPTTDSFFAIMGNRKDRIIPGSAAVVSTNLPYSTLDRFGQEFLNKFQVSYVNSPILDNITLIDTPGVLSGEKQSVGRAYYPEVVKWFANRADLILLFFDAHKLDISDEFKSVIDVLKGHEGKMRVILNKADMVNGQQLIRVQGALMWSLGKILNIPEVCRVYICSFNDEELRYKECENLLKSEEENLLNDLRVLPGNAAIRKVNEMIKRNNLVKIHGLIISYLKDKMPLIFGNKDSKQNELINNLPEIFKELQKNYGLAPSDFPNVEFYQEKLRKCKFSKFSKCSKESFDAIKEELSIIMTQLNDFSQENDNTPEIKFKSKYLAKL